MDFEYRLVTYEGADTRPHAGVLVAGRVHDVTEIFGGDVSVMDLLADWTDSQARIGGWLRNGLLTQGKALAEVTLLAPVQYPTNFYCAGANYWDHLAEMADFIKQTTGKEPRTEKAPEPWLFVKTTRGTIVGEGHRVTLPKFSKAIDWEAEMGVVIGRETREVSEAEAMDSVAGYLVINDLSARDHVKREGSPFIYDWIGQKCWDGAAPMGPWLTPAQFVKDPTDLSIKLWVNNALKQNSNSSKMVHTIAEQIAYLSRHVTLYPGDIIATGTPAGVGMPRQEFLKAGDVIKIEIDGLGTLTHSMVAA
jgi:2-keto-4-pentenoate hydratase/2-oxohepta-3-ene-1,7-dioic acid hydratase in catechol pathway